ncbi:MAG: Vitamin B12 dependent methionine synthase activation subunit [Clostridia bacterium]|nr:Vitamin B12 dependent methionine synthase activation subunit [Clostridia bacterium]MBR2417800.1 Vitamin B12 dependent methionine synthase activation subunit [Clostridia bacterium]
MKENPIILRTSSCAEIIPDKKMALRFMGCKELSGDLAQMYEESLEEYKKAAVFKAVYRKTSVAFFGEKGIRFDFGEIESADLRKNLAGCSSAFIFAATSGSGVDRLILKHTKLSPADAMVTDCIASSGIEVFCDKINEEMRKGRVLKPRYSPGYGDVSLCCQSEILSFLDAYRKIGLTLTETYLMTPIKSVTAIVGIVEE